ncbi:NAD-dependent epimerase/dehydratase family protein [Myroides sp. mNGS23_01]|nr:NAD-dependent epimerase/dehydratase family protein [Myroides sp. mNGS23_01]WHT38749.1 NAD-dependent epimerase/dehydratase family protein [Myroides sp. mNGS23_01]
MQKKIVLIGGTGQIGYAITNFFVKRNWEVYLLCRSKYSFNSFLSLLEKESLAFIPNIKPIYGRKEDDNTLIQIASIQPALLVDLLSFTAKDAKQILAIQKHIGQYIVLSSSSVYKDNSGRTLDEASVTGFPDFPLPIKEENPTVQAGDTTYSTHKIAMEEYFLKHSNKPVTILRPCAIYGICSHHPREWWFVKRVLDKRPYIPLKFKGESTFHTSSTQNIAKVIWACIGNKAHQIVNVADQSILTVKEIGEFITNQLAYRAEFVAYSAIESSDPFIGFSPWSVAAPFILDTSYSEQLLHQVGLELSSYQEDSKAYIQWLSRFSAENWETHFPQLAAYPFKQFDYEKEDLVLSK